MLAVVAVGSLAIGMVKMSVSLWRLANMTPRERRDHRIKELMEE
ncbi:MAG: hypothetical protein V4674_01325 [Patescibacteria group bacterium]